MNSNSFENHHKKSNSIVSDHDSATQISERDDLLFRIEKIRQPEKRQQTEQAFKAMEEENRALDRRVEQAEAAYVDKNLKPEPALEFTPDDIAQSYEDRVRMLKEDYAKTQDAQALVSKVEADQKRNWQTFSQSVNASLRRQEHGHYR